MDDILFTCRSCRQDLVVDAKGAGLTIACPTCSQSVRVPSKGDTGIIRVPEADALRSRVDELESTAAAERERAAQAGNELQRMKQQISERDTQLQALEKALASEKEKSLGLVQSQQEAAEALEALRTEHTEAAARADFYGHEVERLEEDYKRLQRELSARTEEWRELKARLRASDSEREELALATSRTAHDPDLLQRNRDLAAHRDRLTVELAEARGALLRTETQLYHAMSAREGLTVMVANLRSNLHGTSELYHNMAATVDTLENEVQRLQAELRGLRQCEAA